MDLKTSAKTPYLTAKQASEYLSINQTSLYTLVWRQKIKKLNMGTGKKPRIRFTKVELDRYLGVTDAD